MQKIKVWDLPTRLFHWLLVIMVAALFITGSIGGNLIERHMQLGYAVFALLLFRLVWGIIGGHWSRFTSFFPTPHRVLSYLKGTPHSVHLGHNPLGAFSVFALLTILFLQIGTGLISDDEIAFTGPFISWVSTATSSLATNYHKNYGKIIILALVFTHIIAIIFYKLAKKKNLVPAMIHGYQDAPESAAMVSSKDNAQSNIVAAIVLILCINLVWLLITKVA
jgi:cytochrome b